jgi:hypothetical protein
MAMDFKSKGGTMANNKPVGSAGQPFGNMKKEVAESKKGAISRRLAKKKDESKK